jgi:hypothetical protein
MRGEVKMLDEQSIFGTNEHSKGPLQINKDILTSLPQHKQCHLQSMSCPLIKQ